MKETRHFGIEIANKKYRNLLLVSYALIAAIAVGIVVTGIFAWFHSYTKKVISDMAVSQLENMDNIVESDLENYRSQLQNAYQEPSIRSYLFTNNKNFENEYDIGRYLSNMVVNNGAADYVGLYKKGEETRFYGWRSPGEKARKQIEQKIEQTKDDMEFFLISEEERDYLCLFFTDRPKLESAPERGLIYALNLDTWKKQILSEKTADRGFLILSDSGGIIMRDNLTEKIAKQLWEEIRKEETGIYDNGEIVSDDKKYLYNSKYDEKNRVYILTFQDLDIEMAQMDDIKSAVYLPVVVNFFLVLLLAVFMANKIYYPLERFFLKLRSNTDLVAGSEVYSLQQMEITSEKILRQIDIVSRQYHSDKVLRYLGEAGRENIPSVLKLKDRGEVCRMYLCWNNEKKITGALTEKVRNKLEEISSGCKVDTFADIDSTWFLVLIKSSERLPYLKEDIWVKQCLNQLIEEADVTGCRLYFAVSECTADEDELSEIFRKMLTYIRYRLFDSETRIMDRSYFEQKIEEEIPRKKGDEVLAEIRTGKEEAAGKKMVDILDELGNYEIQKSLTYLAELCTQMRMCNNEIKWNRRQQQEHYLKYYMKLSSISEKWELRQYFQQQIKDICLDNEIFPEKTLRINMIKAVEYIQEHYRDSGISVEQVTEKFHISVSYFSKLFREYTGMTFPEFINDLRLTYAKELLIANPDISIKKVTEACGFGSVSYFSSQFKKKFGISPSAMKTYP